MNAGACWEYRKGRKSVFRGVTDWNFWTIGAGSLGFIGGESSSGRAWRYNTMTCGFPLSRE